MNAALVMRDRETDSWWSIITGEAIGGTLNGTPLVEIPASQKMRWREWKALHPDTKVLSVDGVEHEKGDPYGRYFRSSDGFRGLTSDDKRMYDKASIYAFQLNKLPYAVAHKAYEGGKSFKLSKNRELFLYRNKGSEMFESTFAYIADGEFDGKRFVENDGEWMDNATGSRFSSKAGFAGSDDAQGSEEAALTLERLTGFDTFWYTWTTTHKNVIILE